MDTIECKGMTLIDMVILVKFAKSKSQARRLIESGAIRIEDRKVTDINTKVFWDKEVKQLFILCDEDKIEQ